MRGDTGPPGETEANTKGSTLLFVFVSFCARNRYFNGQIFNLLNLHLFLFFFFFTIVKPNDMILLALHNSVHFANKNND